jgi:hypothetical protein
VKVTTNNHKISQLSKSLPTQQPPSRACCKNLEQVHIAIFLGPKQENTHIFHGKKSNQFTRLAFLGAIAAIGAIHFYDRLSELH